jgi:glutamate-1-semialdehyde 2,1-aminomutase
MGIRPDMATYAKSLANGYPLAAIGGRREIMSIIGHGVSQGGTFTNNKPGVAATYATLNLLKTKPILQTIQQRGGRLMSGLKEIFEENEFPAVISGYPAMFSFALGVHDVTCQRDWDKSDKALYLQMVEMAIERGVMPDLDPREPWFLCYEHTDKDVDDTLQIFADIVKQTRSIRH